MKNKSLKNRLLKSLKTIRLTSSLIVIAMYSGQMLYSQQPGDTSGKYDKRNFKEELFLRTDRDIYITGEQVLLKVYKLGGLTHSPVNLSKVVYVEMLDKNNFPLRQLKIKADNSSGASVFTVPDNISSGNYIIRAYTNWMQNFPVDQFFYTAISVINPFESIDHLKLPSKSKNADSPGINSNDLNPALISENNNSVAGPVSGKITYSISLDQKQYPVRSRVRLSVTATDANGKPVQSDLSVSVTRAALINPTLNNSFHNLSGKNDTYARATQRDYLAELEGHLLSGHIRLKATDEPIKNIDISLSFVGKTALCQFAKTDANGEFNFLVKQPGLNEIVIQPLSPEITGYYIEINQHFSNSFSDIKPADFYIDSSLINDINKAVVGMQVTNIYSPFRQSPENEKVQPMPDFYGKPENSIKMSDYIELTSIREVVKEIIPNVYTLKQNGKYDFKLINKFRGQPFENKPLVLVDGVPVYDFEKVLNISSKDIERADVINTRYFFSDNVFDGIVSFVTKKGNLSAMDFDNSIFRQVYEGCSSVSNFKWPDYSTLAMKESHLPDFRNTLFWEPEAHSTRQGNTEVEFFTSDESTEYKIIVEGITPDGKTGYATATFVVK